MSFHIENRKVQQTGGSSFIISLPKEWINEHNIKKGDNLSILSQPDGNLMITPYTSTQEYVREKVINVEKDTTPDYLFRQLIGVYIMGYSSIIEEKSLNRL
ncbi:MAG: AbrB/MazE/SpoVT family DNA-binding domain-containing protein [Promethearchaeota archaeon]